MLAPAHPERSTSALHAPLFSISPPVFHCRESQVAHVVSAPCNQERGRSLLAGSARSCPPRVAGAALLALQPPARPVPHAPAAAPRRSAATGIVRMARRAGGRGSCAHMRGAPRGDARRVRRDGPRQPGGADGPGRSLDRGRRRDRRRRPQGALRARFAAARAGRPAGQRGPHHLPGRGPGARNGSSGRIGAGAAAITISARAAGGRAMRRPARRGRRTGLRPRAPRMRRDSDATQHCFYSELVNHISNFQILE